MRNISNEIAHRLTDAIGLMSRAVLSISRLLWAHLVLAKGRESLVNLGRLKTPFCIIPWVLTLNVSEAIADEPVDCFSYLRVKHCSIRRSAAMQPKDANIAVAA